MRCRKPQLLMGQLPCQWRHHSLPHLRQQGLLVSRLQPQRLQWSLWSSMELQEGVAICIAQCQAAGAMCLCLLYDGPIAASLACMPVSEGPLSRQDFQLATLSQMCHGLSSGPASLLSSICGCTLAIWS